MVAVVARPLARVPGPRAASSWPRSHQERGQHRIATGEGPVRPVQGGAEIPEGITSRKLAPPLLPPGPGIAVQTHRLPAVAQIHHAAWIERLGRRRRRPQVGEQAPMDASGLQASHLGGAHIEAPGSAAERAGTASALVVGLQQLHRHPFPCQQGGGGEAGDAAPNHHHILFRGEGVVSMPPSWRGGQGIESLVQASDGTAGPLGRRDRTRRNLLAGKLTAKAEGKHPGADQGWPARRRWPGSERNTRSAGSAVIAREGVPTREEPQDAGRSTGA